MAVVCVEEPKGAHSELVRRIHVHLPRGKQPVEEPLVVALFDVLGLDQLEERTHLLEVDLVEEVRVPLRSS